MALNAGINSGNGYVQPETLEYLSKTKILSMQWVSGPRNEPRASEI